MGTECLPWEETRGARMGYFNQYGDAERRRKRGEKQRQCQNCARWFWPDCADDHQNEGMF